VETGLRIGGAVWRFWFIRGYMAEGRDRLESLLSRPEASLPTRVRARALDGAGVLALNGIPMDCASARSHYEEMVAIGRELGDKQILGVAHNGLAHVYHFENDHEKVPPLLEQGLAFAREAGDRWETAFSLSALAISQMENPGDAWPLYEEALAIRRELGDRISIANSLRVMATMAAYQGDYVRARALSAETLSIHRELGPTGLLGMLFASGDLARIQGDHAAARAYFEELRAVAPKPQRNLEWTSDDGIYGLGELARDEGELGAARALLEECLASWRELGVVPAWNIARDAKRIERRAASLAVQPLGDVARYQGRYEEARALYEETLTHMRQLREDVYQQRLVAGVLLKQALVAQKQGDMQRAAAVYQESLTCYREAGGTGTKLESAICFEACGTLAAAQGQAHRAARLLSAAAALSEAMGAPLPPVDRPEFERSVAAARALLGEEAFAAAWAEGRAAPLEQAIRSALEEGAGT
jgi:tetratricopeptide (TPR) repeat protein